MQAKEIKDILVINPGSTTTKIAVFTDLNKTILFEKNIVHDEQKLLEFPRAALQQDYRREIIIKELEAADYDMDRLTAVVGRGGVLPGLAGGGYKINDVMCEEMANHAAEHASCLGALLAFQIAGKLQIPSFIYDATTGTDLLDIAKVTGIAGLEKYGAVHLLNSRAQAIKYAQGAGRDYRELNFINCHMGGGITVNAMKNGKVIDAASYDDGPMAPERSGGVPLLLMKDLCFDGKHTEEDIERLIAGKGGLYSYLGTKSVREVEKRIDEGDTYAEMIFEAMGFQVAKAIAGLSCVLEGKVDVIILTGGAANSDLLCRTIKKYCGHIAPIEVMPGESEMEALANGTLRMMTGEEEAKELK